MARPFVTYPDLFDQTWAKAALLAEQVEARKMTRAEANAQLADIKSQVATEEQRRNLANRSVAAQENVATAAPNFNRSDSVQLGGYRIADGVHPRCLPARGHDRT